MSYVEILKKGCDGLFSQADNVGRKERVNEMLPPSRKDALLYVAPHSLIEIVPIDWSCVFSCLSEQTTCGNMYKKSEAKYERFSCQTSTLNNCLISPMFFICDGWQFPKGHVVTFWRHSRSPYVLVFLDNGHKSSATIFKWILNTYSRQINRRQW